MHRFKEQGIIICLLAVILSGCGGGSRSVSAIADRSHSVSAVTDRVLEYAQSHPDAAIAFGRSNGQTSVFVISTRTEIRLGN